MTTKHCSDDEIQQYIIDQLNCEASVIDHISACEQCKVKVNAYQLLFDAIREQEQAAFDFNLAEWVVAKLPAPKPAVSKQNYLIYIITGAVIAIAGMGCYFFRSYLLSLFAGITPYVIYLIIISVVSLLIAAFIDMYKTFQKKMRALDVY